MKVVPLQQYTGTIGRGFSVEPISGALILDSGVEYRAQDGRVIPIKMSLSGYAYALVRVQNGEALKVADIIEHREVDRFEPMRIRPVSEVAAKQIIQDISDLSIDTSTARIEGGRPAPGTCDKMTPSMFCSAVWECKHVAGQIDEWVPDNVLLYRSPRTTLLQWEVLEVPSGHVPYLEASVVHILSNEAQAGGDPSQVVFANVWHGQPDYASKWLQDHSSILNADKAFA